MYYLLVFIFDLNFKMYRYVNQKLDCWLWIIRDLIIFICVEIWEIK